MTNHPPEPDPAHEADLPPTGLQHASPPPKSDPGYRCERGQRVGAYTLRDPLGRGGFGEVWRAERRNPSMTVAIKLVRPERADQGGVARFHAECQALALLEHPGIARIHDAGVTDDGLPYLAMEYVHGVGLSEFCDRERLPIAERLELLARIAEAVHHAHTQGIIHRDLKPENILVGLDADGRPAPRIVDFGIAKAVNKNVRLTDLTLTQDLHTAIGTPAYMSPEQLESSTLGVDTRTDIFALGVILYDLLTGALPIAAPQSGGLQELIALARADRPEPLERFAQLTAQQRADAAHRRGQLRPEQLEAVLRTRVRHLPMKAMRAERQKRFSSAAALAQDIRHYLNDEDFAEAAREPAIDRFARSVRRNRPAYALGAGVALLLVAGIVSTSIGLQRARAAEARASADAERARLAEEAALQRAAELAQVTEFQRDQLASIDPAQMGARLRADLIAEIRSAQDRLRLSADERRALDQAAEAVVNAINPINLARLVLERSIFDQTLSAIDRRFETQPLLRAAMLEATGRTLRELGLPARASEAQSRALSLYRAALGDASPMAFRARVELAASLIDTGRATEAESELRAVLAVPSNDLSSDDPLRLRARLMLAVALSELGRFDEAESLARETLADVRTGQSSAESRRAALLGLASVLSLRAREAEAEPLYREALEIAERTLTPEHPETLQTLHNLAQLMQTAGRHQEAEALLRRTLEARRRTLGDDHPATLTTISNLAVSLRAMDRLDEAEPLYREALEGRRAALGADHPDTLQSLNNVGVLLLESLHRPVEAEAYILEAFERRRRALGASHPATLASLVNVGVLRRAQQRPQDARDAFAEAHARSVEILGPAHPSTISTARNLAMTQIALRQPQEAAALLRNTLMHAQAAMGPSHATTMQIHHDLGDALARSGRFDEAETVFLEAYERRRDALGPASGPARRSLQGVADVRLAQGDAPGAARAYAQLVDLARNAQPPDDPGLIMAANALATALQQAADPVRAAHALAEALHASTRVYGRAHATTLTLRHNLASAAMQAADAETALRVLRDGEPDAREAWAADPARLASYLDRLAAAFHALGREDEARTYAREAQTLREPGR